jgi:copper homeostasis protein
MKIEICIDSVEGMAAALQGGAGRVELCADLLSGGTTPSAGMIRHVRTQSRLGLMVIIRPRGGDFLYSDLELDVMLDDIRTAAQLGADGVVIGCLRADGRVDLDRNARLIDAARPLAVTFHRAFDLTPDPRQALEDLVCLGADRVLTSGQEAGAFEGRERIAELQRQAAGRIIVMPGGGITPDNVGRIIEATGVTEVHLSARREVESGATYRNDRVRLGGTSLCPEYRRQATDPAVVRAVVSAVVSAVVRPPAGGRQAGGQS